MSIEEQALRTVNAARVAFGMAPLTELPSATRGQSSDCVLARALHGVGGKQVTVAGNVVFGSEEAARWFAVSEGVSYLGQTSDGYAVDCPQHLRQLWGDFDHDRTPEYDRPQTAREYSDRLDSSAFVA